MEPPRKRPRLTTIPSDPPSARQSFPNDTRHKSCRTVNRPDTHLDPPTHNELQAASSQPVRKMGLCKALHHIDRALKSKDGESLTTYSSRVADEWQFRNQELSKIITAENIVNTSNIMYKACDLRAIMAASYSKGHGMSMPGADAYLETHSALTGDLCDRWIARVLSTGSAAFNSEYLECIGFRSTTDQHATGHQLRSLPVRSPAPTASTPPASRHSVSDNDNIVVCHPGRKGQRIETDEAGNMRYTRETAADIQTPNSMSSQDPQLSLAPACRHSDTNWGPVQEPSQFTSPIRPTQSDVADDTQSEGTLRHGSVRADQSNSATLIHPACIQSLSSAIHLEEIVAATAALHHSITATSDLIEGSGILGGDATVCHVASNANPALDLIFERATGLKEWKSRLRKHVRESKLGRDVLSMSLWSRFLFDDILTVRRTLVSASNLGDGLKIQAQELAEEMYDVLQAHIKLNMPVSRSSGLTDVLIQGFETMCEHALKLKALCLATEGVYSWEWPDISDTSFLTGS